MVRWQRVSELQFVAPLFFAFLTKIRIIAQDIHISLLQRLKRDETGCRSGKDFYGLWLRPSALHVPRPVRPRFGLLYFLRLVW
jgi:hypothetical protein